jgi:hypothetical protein
LRVKSPLPNYLLPFLFLLLFISSGCCQRVIHQDGFSSTLRVAVTTDESSRNSRLSSAYHQVVQTINNRLVRQEFDVVNLSATEVIELDRNGSKIGMGYQSRENLLQKYGIDALIFVHLNSYEDRRDAGGLCRLRLSLDSWGVDAGGRDLGVSIAKTTVASKDSCGAAILAAARDLGYFAGGTIASGLRAKQVDGVNGKAEHVQEIEGKRTGFN